MPSTKMQYFSPSRSILFSLLFAIIAGTILLSLSFARTRFIPFIDLFFTSTSSICVTGLLTVPLDCFTREGHIIIMILMQIGGLGLITLTLCAISLFTNLGLATQVMAGEMFDLDSWSGTRRLISFILLVTLFCELTGAVILFQTLKHHFSFYDACIYSLFESISAFCNVGMDIVPNGIRAYTNDYVMLSTLGTLVLLGGIGFITLKELFEAFCPFFNEKKRRNFSLQTKIIFSHMLTLTVLNTGIFWLLERNNTLEHMSLPQQITNALFTAINSRSCGFLTVFPNTLQNASLLSLMANSFIGSAPGSTGSGVKITTIAIFIATINTAIYGKHSVEIKGRRIMKDQVYKALAVVSLSLLWVMLVTFILLITERSWHFLDIMFEAFGAFSTLGVSIGITPYLSIIGKMLIIVTMFVGRIGSLTLMIALRPREGKSEFSYPEERVMIS